MTDKAGPSNRGTSQEQGGASNQASGLLDISHSTLVQKAKLSAELEKVLFLQSCSNELRSGTAADRRLIELQANQVFNQCYEKELIDAIRSSETEKEQIKDLIKAVQAESEQMRQELNQLQAHQSKE